MNTLLIILQMASFVPTIEWSTSPAVVERPAVLGTGTLLVAACEPSETVRVGSYRTLADAQGIAHFTLPAQSPGDEPYRVQSLHGESVVNGFVSVGNLLTAVCR